jgi:hypothetical protein
MVPDLPGPIPPPANGSMRVPVEKAKMVLRLLVEGSGIQSAERITGVHRDHSLHS